MSNIKSRLEPVPVTSPVQQPPLSPTWLEFVRFCRELGHGEIERLSIQNGLPVIAEITKKKVKFMREQ
ncbi:MAG: hypothetical protein JWO80_453 [Bryobacterales bacterium]|nr:hypothetical protein [Bryobacterales bacterium]